MQRPTAKLPQFTMGVAFIVILGASSLWVLSPFLLALVWAAMIVIATWPVLMLLQRVFGGRRSLAAASMSLLLLLVFMLPLAYVLWTAVDHLQGLASWVGQALDQPLPRAPQWLAEIPRVGERLAAQWNAAADGGPEMLQPYAMAAVAWIAGQLGSVGTALGHLFFTLVIAAILYAQGNIAATGIRRFLFRLAGESGDRAAVLAAQAVRGVALGVVVTAVAQTALSGIGLVVTGVPYAGALTLLILVLCIAQLGPILVLLPAVIWMYSTGDAVWATVLLVFTVVVGAMDNVLRPYLIKKGADLPLVLIFAGVIGGLLSIGMVGIFVGPVVLAVTYRLLEGWVQEQDRTPRPPETSAG